ncbi:hypothetical protein HYPSUDRAFT_146028, partial [Hypholoma sublateritium FD-334 SS-4]
VLMRTSDISARYNATTPEASNEWMAIFPRGAGVYRLHALGSSEENRAVFVAMYHEMHCVQILSAALVDNKREDWPHLRHCLNYLRQLIMCRPDLTLESGYFQDNHFISTTAGSVHVCQDWRKPHDFLENDMRMWMNDTSDTN